MNIKTENGKSILDYRYKGQRYRPVLGYGLSPDEAQEAALRVINSIHAHVGGTAPKTGTFAEFVPTYIKYLKALKTDLDGRNASIVRCHLLPHFGAIPLSKITLDTGLEYLAKRSSAAPGTIERECAVLKAIINLAVDEEALDKDRLKRLPVPKYVERTRVLEGWELLRLQKVASPHLFRLILVALQIGLRESKLVEADVAWTAQKPDGWWMYPSPGSRIKGVPAEVALNRLAYDALHGPTPRIAGRFFSQWSKGQVIPDVFRDTVKRAGLHDLKFHDLRHTFGSWLKSLGVEYVVVEKMLGHALPGTGDLYIHGMAWAPLMRDAVTKLEAHTRAILNGAEMGSHGQLTPSHQDVSTRKTG